MKSIEAQLNEALDTIETLKRYVASLKVAFHRERINIAKVKREVRLQEAKLTPDGVKRLHEAFARSTNNAGLKEAINCERKQHGQRN